MNLKIDISDAHNNATALTQLPGGCTRDESPRLAPGGPGKATHLGAGGGEAGRTRKPLVGCSEQIATHVARGPLFEEVAARWCVAV